eukprot:TRINITY_DN14023_c0_g1_i1.p1 TRINITY_DN14023_c0_g1~~TRINITY_DN14023_c0_g1_i1.p1  ORF type:complete len:552 (-),score=125.08 TRINITY_DN14023_c0_g1_i1:430-2085(-)
MESSVLSDMLGKMRMKSHDDDRTILSKKLSYVLRHGAKQLDLTIDSGGYVRVNDLLAVDELFGGVSLEAMVAFVFESNREKQRYELHEEDGEWMIRATSKLTMQGLEKSSHAGGGGGGRERKERGRRSAGGSSAKEARRSAVAGGGSGERKASSQHINEDDFIQRWRLDRLARARLSELPVGTRQLAMLQFSPGPQVPASDFPKVFVAYCKRFRGRWGKDEGEVDGDYDEQADATQSPLAGSSGGGGGGGLSGGRSRQRKKTGRSKDTEEASREARLGAVAPTPASPEDLDQSVDEPHFLYDSPASSPRSLCGAVPSVFMGRRPDAMCVPLSPQHLASPCGLASTMLSPPTSPMGIPPSAPPPCAPRLGSLCRPPVTPPPPPAYAPAGVPMLPASMTPPSRAPPPPPAHAPQVLGTTPTRGCSFQDSHQPHNFSLQQQLVQQQLSAAATTSALQQQQMLQHSHPHAMSSTHSPTHSPPHSPSLSTQEQQPQQQQQQQQQTKLKSQPQQQFFRTDQQHRTPSTSGQTTQRTCPLAVYVDLSCLREKLVCMED